MPAPEGLRRDRSDRKVKNMAGPEADHGWALCTSCGSPFPWDVVVVDEGLVWDGPYLELECPFCHTR